MADGPAPGLGAPAGRAAPRAAPGPARPDVQDGAIHRVLNYSLSSQMASYAVASTSNICIRP